MSKWKIQAVEPDTCNRSMLARILPSADPQPEISYGCRYLEIWDVEAPIESRTHSVAAFERVCPDHDTDLPEGLMLWVDGHWKDIRAYIEYQRAWFRHQNFLEWTPLQPIPPQLLPYRNEPITPGSKESPSISRRSGLNTAYRWNREHNRLKNTLVEIAGNIPWEFSGHGEQRVLKVQSKGSQISRDKINAIIAIQFGSNKLEIID